MTDVSGTFAKQMRLPRRMRVPGDRAFPCCGSRRPGSCALVEKRDWPLGTARITNSPAELRGLRALPRLAPEELDHHPAASAKAQLRRESVGGEGAESTIRIRMTSREGGDSGSPRRDKRLLPAHRPGTTVMAWRRLLWVAGGRKDETRCLSQSSVTAILTWMKPPGS